MKFTLLSIFLLSGIFCFSQSKRKEQRIREIERIELQDHLEPERGDLVTYKFLLDYHSRIRSILLDTLSERPIIRMVVLPSFSSEYVISIDMIDNDYLITKIELDSNIWYSKHPEQIKKSITTKIIKPELADSLSSLYVLALSKTRYPDKPILISDGTRYHFAARGPYGIQTATKHSPRTGTRIAELVHLTEKLMNNFDEIELINEIEKLKKRL